MGTTSTLLRRIVPGLLLAVLLPAAASAASRPRGPQELLDAEAELAKAEADLVTAEDLDSRVPGWARVEPDWTRASSSPDPEALRAVVDKSGSPRLRALACLWLAVEQDPRDLHRLGRLIETDDKAGKLPEVVTSVSAGSGRDVVWRVVTVGDAAKQALRRLTGKRFVSPGALHAWRRDRGEPTKTYSWWRARYDATPPLGRDAMLENLRAEDPLLFARLVMQIVPPRDPASGPGDLRLIRLADEAMANQLGPTGLGRVLLEDLDWDELEHPETEGRLKQWILLQWRAIVGPRQGRLLSDLWSKRGLIEPYTVHPELAQALVESEPARTIAVLCRLLIEKPRPELPLQLHTFAAAAPVEKVAVLAYWFNDEDTPTADVNRVAILEGLVEAGPAGKAILRAMLDSHVFKTDSPVLVEALVRAGRSFGCRDRFPALAAAGPTPPVALGASEDELKVAAALAASATRARKDCLQRLKRFLARG